MKRRHPLVGDVRGLGLLMGVDLVEDRDAKTPALDAGESILYRALDKGLSLKLTMGSVLTLTPPLTITEAEMDAAIDILDECLADEAVARGVEAGRPTTDWTGPARAA
ncbi:MAG: aminotransferase class III-fold pyridoxal phosphate-dependent enzyme [Proteobacteria bacterium]|nr:aminotransferase class III-fold pyridoxal phosphate-dependent enzyme [Pseudomonadota bacterium]